MSKDGFFPSTDCPVFRPEKALYLGTFHEGSEPHKFVLNLSQRLELGSSNKHVALQNSFITRGKI